MFHSHDHHHNPRLTKISNAFIAGIVLNVVFVFIQVAFGIKVHSLSLLSDAGHNFTDVVSLLLSLIAVRLDNIKTTRKYTYGYRKTSILVALINSCILLVSIGIICYEAIIHLMHPVALPGKTVAAVALAGFFINGISAFFFFRDKNNDLNIKSAFLHLAADALVSLGIVIGGIFIYFTGWYQIDAILSLAIALVILYSTWHLLSDSIQLSLDGVPNTVQPEAIKLAAQEIKGVRNIHHLHIWALSTSENALTAHLLLDNNIDTFTEQTIKETLKEKLLHLNIHHSTLETEREAWPCKDRNCSEGNL